MKPKKFAVMTFGLGGNTGILYPDEDGSYAEHPRTSHWYLKNPEELPRYIPSHYSPEELEGAFIVDIREVVEKNPILGIKAPLVAFSNQAKITLEEQKELVQYYKNSPKDPATSMVVLSGFLGGLDTVDLSTYIEWWRFHGARVGRFTQGEILWEEGEKK